MFFFIFSFLNMVFGISKCNFNYKNYNLFSAEHKSATGRYSTITNEKSKLLFMF